MTVANSFSRCISFVFERFCRGTRGCAGPMSGTLVTQISERAHANSAERILRFHPARRRTRSLPPLERVILLDQMPVSRSPLCEDFVYKPFRTSAGDAPAADSPNEWPVTSLTNPLEKRRTLGKRSIEINRERRQDNLGESSTNSGVEIPSNIGVCCTYGVRDLAKALGALLFRPR